MKAIRAKEIKIKIKAQNGVSNDLRIAEPSGRSFSVMSKSANGFNNHLNNENAQKRIPIDSDNSLTDEDLGDSDEPNDKHASTNNKQHEDRVCESRMRIDVMRQLGASSVLSNSTNKTINYDNKMTSSTYSLDFENDANPVHKADSHQFSKKSTFTKSRSFFEKKTKVKTHEIWHSFFSMKWTDFFFVKSQ